MNYAVLKHTLSDLLRQRNFAYLVALGLLLINSLLSVAFFSKETRIVVIPNMATPDKRYEFKGAAVNDAYLIDWADHLLTTLLCVNPHTVERKTKLVLEWTISSTALTEKLIKQAKALQRDHISTVFYPKDFVIDRDRQEVSVKGTFVAYMGQGSPVVSEKTYCLGWKVLGNGAMGLSHLKENHHED
jgi:type IV conjugative transfer system protein TraE